MRRPTQKILNEADELARRFEDYEPSAEDLCEEPAEFGHAASTKT